MSDKYEKVKKYYDNGLWSNDKVKNAVVHNWITKNEYKKITGEEYTQNS